jgi:hypothetical protein
MLTAGGWLMDHWPYPREREQGKEAPSNQAQQKPNSKAGQLVNYRLIPEPEDNTQT